MTSSKWAKVTTKPNQEGYYYPHLSLDIQPTDHTQFFSGPCQVIRPILTSHHTFRRYWFKDDEYIFKSEITPVCYLEFGSDGYLYFNTPFEVLFKRMSYEQYLVSVF